MSVQTAPANAVPAARHADPLLARAWDVLEAVPDPEIPVVSIRELGILRDVRRAEDGQLEVVITPTYSGCPAMSQIAEDIAAALQAADLPPHRIETVLAPAWTTDWITQEARDKLRAYGIAPPVGQCGIATPRENVVRFVGGPGAGAAGPRGGAARPPPRARGAGPAGEALYRCVDCREPFDYFKPY
ncbi:phenylacetate-CoA oxygenase subunit PaaJ [Burkholderia contaminans]|uniref:1,2-phenylacetyl-CoA epoxidase subunit PaaD n=1 Tax=Burkholderia contaminans TaxID=488447 RepID=UPI001C9743D5|nr:1,2-phenylacetyl-CoA epoxidase subunit PaaD [Burkholderia contaminans]MBY4828109.1 phenylacetate-CoA oxygenase subunit PaaJ [Burkholderia contaminans]